MYLLPVILKCCVYMFSAFIILIVHVLLCWHYWYIWELLAMLCAFGIELCPSDIRSSLLWSYIGKMCILILRLELYVYYKFLELFLIIHFKNIWLIIYKTYTKRIYNYVPHLSEQPGFLYLFIDLMELYSYQIIRACALRQTPRLRIGSGLVAAFFIRILHFPWYIIYLTFLYYRYRMVYVHLDEHRWTLVHFVKQQKLTFDNWKVLFNGPGDKSSPIGKQMFWHSKNAENALIFQRVQRGVERGWHWETQSDQFLTPFRVTSNMQNERFGSQVGLLTKPLFVKKYALSAGGVIHPSEPIVKPFNNYCYLSSATLYRSLFLYKNNEYAFTYFLDQTPQRLYYARRLFLQNYYDLYADWGNYIITQEQIDRNDFKDM